MLNKASMANRFPGVSEGMPVYSRDGERLGKIIELSDDFMTVQKGIFFPRDFTLRYDDIAEVRDGSLYLGYDQQYFNDWRNDSYQGWSNVSDINEGRLQTQPRDEYRDRYKDRYLADTKEQVDVPVMEEKLEAQKVARPAGEVRLRKIVHTELQHFSIPVMKEEVKIERVSAGEQEAGARTAESAFQEGTTTIPLMEEEVTVTKRPVLKENVRVSKERREEQREVSGEVRKEEVEVERDDKAKKAG